ARAIQVGDDDLVSLAQSELRAILGITAPPAFSRVHRWPLAMPQYVVGHAERIKRIQAVIEKRPGLYLAGNAYSGVGISDCVRTAREAAERVLQFARS
ncbi:MAG: protoporphyrinogen/coproporphyrinogen oxidase, partial [Terriglobia bacterium]